MRRSIPEVRYQIVFISNLLIESRYRLRDFILIPPCQEERDEQENPYEEHRVPPLRHLPISQSLYETYRARHDSASQIALPMTNYGNDERSDLRQHSL